MSKTYEELAELEEAGVELLLNSAVVCRAQGNIARETLSRRVSRGEFPKPDLIIAGRNYWYPSTLRRAREGRNG